MQYVICSTDIIRLLLKSFQQLQANNQQVVEARGGGMPGRTMADALHQTTMMQCFHPNADAASSNTLLPPGYKAITIDGTMYLLNDTMSHLMVVPSAAQVAATHTVTQDITPLDLTNDPFVTPSATKRSNKRHPIVLSEHKQGDSSDSGSVVYVRARIKKRQVKAKGKKVETNPELHDLVSTPPSAPPYVVDVETEDRVLHLRVSTVLEEVETQDLPQTEDFANFVNYTKQDESMTEEAHAAAFNNEIESEQSIDLLAEDSQK
jgi:hypothetical protein